MKRTAIARRTPLARTSAPARKTRMPQRRATARRSSRVENPFYLAWLREQPCGVGVIFRDRASECSGPIDPEHKREGVGMGQKASDSDSWACCRFHHDQRHDGRGVFATMDRAELRTFIRMQIAMYLTAYTAHLAAMPRTTSSPSSAATSPPGSSTMTSRSASAGRNLSSALEQLLPEPGAIAVGATVQLGTREGAVSAVLPDGLVAVAWLDGTVTTEALPSAVRRRA